MNRSTLRGYDKREVESRTCQTCGMLLDDAGEYHPYVFCVLKKARRDPWHEVRMIAEQLQLGDPGEKPPLVRRLLSNRAGFPSEGGRHD